MNIILEQDIQKFIETFPFKSELADSSILITGGTGLIGSMLVRCILALDRNINIVLPVRDKLKAKDLFGEEKLISIIEAELIEFCCTIDHDVQYIIHCASPTSGKYMVEHPVETYELAVDSTKALLRYSRQHNVKGMVFVSSLEYYGQILEDVLVTENMQGGVDGSSSRSSYPLGKRAAEYLCVAYAQEYNVPVKIARLTQTFGAGVTAEDNRVFAQFVRSIIKGDDLVLHTTGESAKPYCYTIDSITAILFILLRGASGDAYNVANSETYISIKEMAEFLRDNFNQNIGVRIECHSDMGYAPVTKLRLSVEKLKALGWSPMFGLKEMFERLIKSLQ